MGEVCEAVSGNLTAKCAVIQPPSPTLPPEIIRMKGALGPIFELNPLISYVKH